MDRRPGQNFLVAPCVEGGLISDDASRLQRPAEQATVMLGLEIMRVDHRMSARLALPAQSSAAGRVGHAAQDGVGGAIGWRLQPAVTDGATTQASTMSGRPDPQRKSSLLRYISDSECCSRDGGTGSLDR